MQNVIFLFFRRMRGPLLLLIAAYAISIGGLVLIPGVDDQGRPWHFDFFHAAYFVSFMGPTIGFGEIPYEFTPAQRGWVMFTIYLTVIAWLYAIGKIFTLLQDPPFVRALTEARFIRAVRAIREPFYIVCGYGETGSVLVRSMCRRDIQPIVIDINLDNINALAIEDLGRDIPYFCGDATDPRHLLEAGLRRSLCQGVVAITDNDEANVAISIASKLVAPDVKVIARAGNQETIANLDSFNTDHIINAFDVFGEHLAMALSRPTLHMLHIWLVSRPGQPLAETLHPPYGKWIICGYGRFGRKLSEYLRAEGCEVTVIEPNPEKAPEGAVNGRGTEAGPLQEAGVDDAVAVVAGTGSDINNLSVVMTARDEKPGLYLVARLGRRRNTGIFAAADLDLIMQSSRIIVWRVLPLLTTPLLSRFLRLMRQENEERARSVGERLAAMTHQQTPETWAFRVDENNAPALHARLNSGSAVTIGEAMRSSVDRDKTHPCLPLLLVRGDSDELTPSLDTPLQCGDRLLLCLREGARQRVMRNLFNENDLEYVVTGRRMPNGAVWRWFAERNVRGNARAN